MFGRLLIANRGEIACRIIQTAQKFHIHCIAIYSEPDKQARHVQMADSAYALGGVTSSESYLRIDKVLAIAKLARADAIHPGYGFLSENADFAGTCLTSNITFIGPPANAILQMGNKSIAKAIMAKAEVPLIPGYHGDNQQDEIFIKEAAHIGYPILLKAAAGGGGKGMRIVQAEDELAFALAATRREAQASFGNDMLLLEKYLAHPRHIEVQIFADTHGNVVHLLERDCSIQRRHQKIIEEAPAPGLSEALRHRLRQAAIRAATAVSYVGAGTVEFLVADNECYFMEMNTRLQVEHPVTEMVTQLDLVAWQLQIANGAKLPLSQAEITAHGHAMEARLYAEDPAQDFLPSCGQLQHLRWPIISKNIRVDTGVQQGDIISPYYDPMLAKIIGWGENRAAAIQNLATALSQLQLVGVTSNRDFLRAVLAEPALKEAKLSTAFLTDYPSQTSPEFLPESPDFPWAVLWLATMYYSNCQKITQQIKGQPIPEVYSPWTTLTGFRLNQAATQLIHLSFNQQAFEVTIHSEGQDIFRLQTQQKEALVSQLLVSESEIRIEYQGQQLTGTPVCYDNKLFLFAQGECYCFLQHQLCDNFTLAEVDETHALVAPLPGLVAAVLVQPEQKVAAKTPLIIIEAMKMEHTIRAPKAGFVKQLYYKTGERVQAGAELVEFIADV